MELTNQTQMIELSVIIQSHSLSGFQCTGFKQLSNISIKSKGKNSRLVSDKKQIYDRLLAINDPIFGYIGKKLPSDWHSFWINKELLEIPRDLLD